MLRSWRSTKIASENGLEVHIRTQLTRYPKIRILMCRASTCNIEPPACQMPGSWKISGRAGTGFWKIRDSDWEWTCTAAAT